MDSCDSTIFKWMVATVLTVQEESSVNNYDYTIEELLVTPL